MATHKEVIGAFIHYMGEKKRLKPGDIPLDLIYQGDTYKMAYEIKPTDTSRQELIRGIGQCAFTLARGIKPYFVIPDHLFREYEVEFGNISWLSIISYDSKFQFKVRLDRKLELKFSPDLAEFQVMTVNPLCAQCHCFDTNSLVCTRGKLKPRGGRCNGFIKSPTYLERKTLPLEQSLPDI